jgi:hypothetical protein
VLAQHVHISLAQVVEQICLLASAAWEEVQDADYWDDAARRFGVAEKA